MYPDYKYDSLLTHAPQLIKYVFAFVLLFIIIPKFMLRNYKENTLETYIANYIKMVFFIIVSGYILVVLKLYEVMTILLIIIVINIRKQMLDNKISSFNDIYTLFQIRLINYTDGLFAFSKTLKTKITVCKKSIHSFFISMTSDYTRIINNSALCLILFFSAWLRFLDTFTHASPPLSDAYVTLAWMKYINNRILFHDGIYPQGFHIYLAFLQKFSTIDSLYVLRYTGPLNGVFIVISLYFIVSRLTSNRTAGLVSAFLYGIAGNLLTMEWTRQASTNSQEFALVFVMPAIYFYYKYIKERKFNHLVIAATATAVIGLIHTIAFAFVGMGMGVILFLILIHRFDKKIKYVFNICAAGILAVLISIIPLVAGYLLGDKFHSSSSEYLTSQMSNPRLPDLTTIDYISLASILLLFFYIILSKKNRKQISSCKLVFMLSLSTFFLYYLGAAITGSTVLSSRSIEIWALASTLSIGTAIYVVYEIFSINHKKKLVCTLLICLSLLIISIYLKPQPIKPYKMEWDSTVEQYFRISSNFRPTEWTIISSQVETYSIAYGKGNHTYVDTILKTINPSLNKAFNNNYSENLFIYYEKQIFEVDKNNSIYSLLEKDYERRKNERVSLENWLQIYIDNHNNISKFYEDSELAVYYIKREIDKEDKNNIIWGNNAND